MSAKKEVYLLVKELIKSIPEIKHWDIWNDNTNRVDEVDSYPVPAVFFEWSAGVWESSTVGSTANFDDKIPNQKGNLQFTLHIVIKKTRLEEKDELHHYDIEQLVYEKIHFKTFEDKEADFIEGKIQRFSDDTIIRHKVLRDWSVVYAVNVLECGHTAIDETLIDAQPVDFDIEPELTIKHQGNTKNGLTINISSE